MPDAPSDPEGDFLYGFPRADWIRSRALSERAAAWVAETKAQGRAVSVTNRGWLQLARLGPGYARRVLSIIAVDWQAHADGLARALEREPGEGDPRRRDSLASDRRHVLEDLAELRRLALGSDS
jgi:hypothetical protein